jgi:hypothetical protein
MPALLDETRGDLLKGSSRFISKKMALAPTPVDEPVTAPAEGDGIRSGRPPVIADQGIKVDGEIALDTAAGAAAAVSQEDRTSQLPPVPRVASCDNVQA